MVPIPLASTNAGAGDECTARSARRRALRGAAEHRTQDVVRLLDVLRAPPPRHEREDLLGVFRGDRCVLVAHVSQIPEWHSEGRRDVVEAVDRDGLLTALHLADELPAQASALAEALLAEQPLLAEGPQALSEEFPDVLDCAFGHGLIVILLSFCPTVLH